MEKRFFDTQEVAAYLDINEKQVYTLIHDRGLPATKITGKWLFPRHLVDRWLEANVTNIPRAEPFLKDEKDLLLISGSDDLLFMKLVGLYRRAYPETVTLQSRAGSGDGLLALRKNLVHIACVHLMDPEGGYSAGHFRERLGDDIVVVNFAVRTQGLLLPPGNPSGITGIEDAIGRSLRWAVREVGTGTRALMDLEFDRLGADMTSLLSSAVEAEGHLETALAVLNGKADIGVGIQGAAGLTGCFFIPMRRENFNLIIRRENFFMRQVQDLLGLLLEQDFQRLAGTLEGYDTTVSGKVVME
jgi:putative molybdopterin biosynthesis protein